MKKHDRYFKVLNQIMSGQEVSSDWYIETFNVARRTANRDLLEFSKSIYNEFKIKLDMEVQDGMRTYKANNMRYVLKGIGDNKNDI